MNTYELVLDVTTTFDLTVQAESEEQAIKQAVDQAYIDTWSCSARYNHAEVYTIELEEPAND